MSKITTKFLRLINKKRTVFKIEFDDGVFVLCDGHMAVRVSGKEMQLNPKLFKTSGTIKATWYSLEKESEYDVLKETQNYVKIGNGALIKNTKLKTEIFI